mmetsp:Transcript_60535/g.141585  ORF Transcript_60535/g.141585 Transcript_60535/m.141585 type:complete len:214 (+) Transcript_60535:349-990(+)
MVIIIADCATSCTAMACSRVASSPKSVTCGARCVLRPNRWAIPLAPSWFWCRIHSFGSRPACLFLLPARDVTSCCRGRITKPCLARRCSRLPAVKVMSSMFFLADRNFVWDSVAGGPGSFWFSEPRVPLPGLWRYCLTRCSGFASWKKTSASEDLRLMDNRRAGATPLRLSLACCRPLIMNMAKTRKREAAKRALYQESCRKAMRARIKCSCL